MGRARTICESLHVAALGVWAGALVVVGGVAAMAFPTARDLDPSVPAFAAYDGPHWQVVGGKIMNPAFLLVDWIGVGALAIAAATLAALVATGSSSLRRVATAVRALALAALAIVTLHTVLIARPEMQRELHAFWDAAQAGEAASAETHKAAFDRLHGPASTMLAAQLALVLLALCAGALDAISHAERQESAGGPA
jgi:hypothetical protein